MSTGRNMGEESQEAGASVPDTRAYAELLEDLKTRIRTTRLRASVAVNREILQLYWELGRAIVTRQESEGWGSSVIKQISADLGKAFPGVRGFSASNIWRMRAFYLAYRGSEEKLARPVRVFVQGVLPSTIPNLPWGHQITIIERALLSHLRDFLLELGIGFAFIASQYRFEVGDQEYRLDLLFYHLRLRCFVAVDLKMGAFKPEHAGKMNFYLAALDDLLRREEDHPSIGLILCKDRNRIVVEYALRGSAQPIGVAEYRLTRRLPEELRGSLPTPEELRKRLK